MGQRGDFEGIRGRRGVPASTLIYFRCRRDGGLCGLLKEIVSAEEEGEWGLGVPAAPHHRSVLPHCRGSPPAGSSADVSVLSAGLQWAKTALSCVLTACRWLSSLHGSLLPHLSVGPKTLRVPFCDGRRNGAGRALGQQRDAEGMKLRGEGAFCPLSADIPPVCPFPCS